jgi:shikimate kinase / 3-dehydroquinate synthase
MFRQNIILTGFMGTGKSAIGRLLAESTGRLFVDTDDEIIRRTGRSISEVFEEEGESTFRGLEKEMAAELANRAELVIATGGGLMLDPLNVLRLWQSGLIICLTASPGEIAARLAAKSQERPLLAGPDLESRIRDLLADREPIYRQFSQFDTSGKTPDEAAGELRHFVLGLARHAPWARVPVSRLPVKHPGGQYEILAGRNLLPDLAAHLPMDGPLLVLTDDHVGPLFACQLDHLSPLTTVTIPAGEKHKNLDTVRAIYDQLITAGLDRHGTLINLGGGVVGDIGGFVAATYLRGIKVVQCPTTLLAMVDASIGGKCGVDLPQGKNLVGAFKQPEVVIADLAALATLPAGELSGGMAEVIKHGLIANSSYLSGIGTTFGTLHEFDGFAGQELLVEAIQVKQAIVETDPFEHGRRAHLNLGHTFAHAIEQVTHYEVAHGPAVAMGLVAAAHLSALLGHCSPGLADQVASYLSACGLPTRLPASLSPEDLFRAMGQDKKRAAGKLRFVLIRRPGDVFLSADVPVEAVRQAWQALMP